jgi:hypothetical protein
MKMKLSMKIFIALWVGLFLIIGGLFFSAYSRLKPESFVGLVKDQIEKNYPGASLTVGEVRYSMAVDFKVHMKNLILTRSGKILGSIGEMEVKLPWWLLLFNKGSSHISISHLKVFVDHEKEVKEKDPIQETQKKDSNKIRVVLPAYLADAKYSIKAKDISIRDSRNSRRYIRLSKLLVREFQYGKNSAFELNIPIEISHKGSQYISELWLFGDITPERESWRLNYRGEFKTRDSHDKMQMEDLIIDGKAIFDPAHMNVNSNLNLLVEKESVGEGALSANDEEFTVDLKLRHFPLSFLEIVEQEVKNPYLTQINGTSDGNLKFIKKSSEEFTRLKGKLSFDGAISLGDTALNGKWNLAVDDARWETSFISPKGEVSFFRRSLIDYDLGAVTQYSEELGFSGMDYRVAINPLLTLGHLITAPVQVGFKSKVSFKKCIFDKRLVDGDITYGISPDRRSYEAHLMVGESNLTLNYQEKNPVHQIFLEAKNFPLIEQFKMFDPFLLARNGILNGKFEGKWGMTFQDGQWLSQLDLSDIDSPQGQLNALIYKVAGQFSLDPSTSPHQAWNFSHKSETTTISSILLDGNDPAKIVGIISQNLKAKSFLVLTYPRNKLWKPVRKEITTPFWPTKEEP